MSEYGVIRQPWSAAVAFAAGDASKDIKAANTNALIALVVTDLTVIITTAAAQAIDIEDNATSAIEVAKFAASLAVGVHRVFNLTKGIQLTPGKKLIYKPAAAGPAGFIIAEGYQILTT